MIENEYVKNINNPIPLFFVWKLQAWKLYREFLKNKIKGEMIKIITKD